MLPKFIKSLATLAAPIGVAFLLLGSLQTAVAKPNPVNLNVQLIGPNSLFMDFNNWCHNSQLKGPDGGWYAIRLTNETNNQIYTGLQLSVAPAISLTIDDPQRYIGNLGPGQSADTFVFIDYSKLRSLNPCSSGDPPVSYSRSITATVISLDNGMNGAKLQALPLQSRGIASANSGGQFISYGLGSGDYVGQLLTTTVVYGFGNNSAGSGLLVQPSGNGNFPDACYRLVGSRVTTSNVSGVAVGVTNALWFPNTDTENNDIVGMEYTFEIRCTGSSANAYPWSEITVGQSDKYNASSYSGSGGVPLPAPEPVQAALSISKSVFPPRVNVGDVVTYTVTFSNVAKVPIQITLIRDALPASFTYLGLADNSQVTPVNSSISPTLNSTGMLDWYGFPYITYSVPASGTQQASTPGALQLVYRARAPMQAGQYTNWVTATVGSALLGPVSANLEVDTPTAVRLAYFDAALDPRGALLSWQTLLETNLLGFKLYRSASPGGHYQLITSQLITPQSLGSPSGARYTWLDSTIQPGGVYYYRLVEVDTSLGEESYGPAMLAFLQLSPRLYLPLILR